MINNFKNLPVQRFAMGTLTAVTLMALPVTARAMEGASEICNTDDYHTTEGCGECLSPGGNAGRWVLGGAVCIPCL
jgi:hypothetical protein